jgi:hypothetical protein
MFMDGPLYDLPDTLGERGRGAVHGGQKLGDALAADRINLHAALVCVRQQFLVLERFIKGFLERIGAVRWNAGGKHERPPHHLLDKRDFENLPRFRIIDDFEGGRNVGIIAVALHAELQDHLDGSRLLPRTETGAERRRRAARNMRIRFAALHREERFLRSAVAFDNAYLGAVQSVQHARINGRRRIP